MLDVRKKEVLSAMRPTEAALYLRRQGWQMAEQGSFASYWTKGQRHAVMVPLDQTFDDYYLRVAELLSDLQQIEDRSREAIFTDVRQSASDILRIRIRRSDERLGTVPLKTGAKMFSAAADLVIYGAAAAVEPRPVHKSLPEPVKELREQARFGHTEQGSYVLNIIAPLPANYDLFTANPRVDQAEPFARRALRVLMGALDQIHLVETEAAVIEQVPQGVSADLCRALYRVSGGTRGLKQLQVSCNWSPAFPVKAGTPGTTSFQQAQVKVIRRAGEELRRVQPVKAFALKGQVIRLARDVDRDSQVEGLITVHASMPGGRKKNVTMALLDPEAHKLAIRAYESKQTIKCTGDLLDRPAAPYLFNVHDFGLA